ncbi:hypothetical protein LguiB_013615 [Lonicera macranthoides]
MFTLAWKGVRSFIIGGGFSLVLKKGFLKASFENSKEKFKLDFSSKRVFKSFL